MTRVVTLLQEFHYRTATIQSLFCWLLPNTFTLKNLLSRVSRYSQYTEQLQSSQQKGTDCLVVNIYNCYILHIILVNNSISHHCADNTHFAARQILESRVHPGTGWLSPHSYHELLSQGVRRNPVIKCASQQKLTAYNQTKFGTWPVQINYITCLPFCMVLFKYLILVIKRMSNEQSRVTS